MRKQLHNDDFAYQSPTCEWLNRLRKRIGQSNSKNTRRSNRSRSAGLANTFEELEDRQLLSASSAVVEDPQVVPSTLTATNAVDLANFQVTANGEAVELQLFDEPGDSIVGVSGVSQLGSSLEIADDAQSIVFTAFPGTTGVDEFLIESSDSQTQRVTVTLLAVATPDEFTVTEGVGLTPLMLLDNDTFPADYDGPGVITSVSFGSQGSEVQIAADGKSVLFNARPQQLRTEQFAYVIDETYSTTVTVQVEPLLVDDLFSDILVYDPSGHTGYRFKTYDEPIELEPLLNDQFEELGYNGPRQITAARLLTSSELSQVEVNQDGQTLLFTPTRGATGTGRIEYTVDGTYVANVRFNIPQLSRSDRVEFDANSGSHTIELLANDFVPADTTIVEIAQPYLASSFNQLPVPNENSELTFSIAPDGHNVIFTTDNSTGRHSFQYTTSVGSRGFLTINVSNPVRADSFSIPQDVTDAPLDVLRNDFYSDAYEGAGLLTLVTSAEHGSVGVSDDGLRLSYTPDPGFVGPDSVTYVVDGQLTARANIVVDSRARNDHFSISFITGQVITLPVLNNDRRNISRITSISPLDPSVGQIAISADESSILFTPTGTGTQFGSFTYTVNNKYTADVSLRSRSLNDARTDQATVGQNESILINVLSNDELTDRARLYRGPDVGLVEEYQGQQEITDVTGSAAGATITIAGDGKSVTYTPPLDFSGRDQFSYMIDGLFEAVVFVNVVRDVRDDRLSVQTNSTANVLQVLLNDSLSNYSGAGLISSVSESVAGGTVAVSEDGQTLLCTPPADFRGVDSFEYRLDDRQVATVQVRVAESVQDFVDYSELREWLIDDALARYESQFGQSFFDPRRFTTTASSFSTTNVQVEGVDEADLVENDGEHLYFIRDNDLIVVKAIPSTELTEVSRYLIEGTPVGMYLHEGRLTIISELERSQYWPSGTAVLDNSNTLNTESFSASNLISASDSLSTSNSFFPSFPPNTFEERTTVVTILDVIDPADARHVKTTMLDGEYIESRSVDGNASIVINSQGFRLPAPVFEVAENQSFFDRVYESRTDYETRIRENFDAILEEILPSFETTDATGTTTSGFLSNPLDWDRILDTPNNNLLSIVEFNAANDADAAPAATSFLASAVNQVYATQDHFYLFQTRNENGVTETLIQQFSWANAGTTELIGIGRVEGRILNQFSVDERNDQLRLALSVSRVTTSGTRSTTDLVTLENTNGQFQAIGSLLDIARGSSAQAIRFEDDLAFVSTFDNASPLNVIDLSHPECPEFAGQIRTAGRTDYIQLIDPTHLVILGSNATNSAPGPLTLSIYDVSEPRAVGSRCARSVFVVDRSIRSPCFSVVP